MRKNLKEIRKDVYKRVNRSVAGADIEDVTQNIMIKIWENDPDDPEKTDEWVTATTMNEIKDYSRKQKRQPNIKRFSEIEEEQDRMNGENREAIFEIPDNMTPEKVLEFKEMREQVKQMLNKLPKEQGKCLKLFYKGYNNSEIQAILNKKQQTVTTLIKEAQEKIKQFSNEEEKISEMFCNYFV